MNYKIKEQIELFKQSLIKDEKSNNTVEKYIRDVKAFETFCDGRELEKETVIAYKTHLIESEYAPRSINSMLASINAFLDFTGCSDMKVKELKLQRETFRRAEKDLTKEEYFRLCHTAEMQGKFRISLIVQTICATGIRVSELEYITVEAAKRGETTVSLKGKTRTVFIVNGLRRKLLDYAKKHNISSGCIFVTSKGRPVNRTTVWRDMKRLCLDARVNPDKVFPHNLRHLFAVSFYSIEKDIAKLSDILGHSSIDTTRIYIMSTGTEHRKRMEMMRLVI